MSQISSKAYSEIYQLIELNGPSYKEKIPKDIYKEIENRRLKDYVPIFDFNKPAIEQVDRKTLAFMAYIDINYCANERDKKEILDNLKKKKENVINTEPFDYDSLFKKKNDEIVEKKEIIQYKKETIFSKISKLINRIMGRKEKNGEKK